MITTHNHAAPLQCLSMICPVHAKAPRVEERKPSAGMHGQSLPSSGAADGEVPLRVYNTMWRRDSDTSFYQAKRVCVRVCRSLQL